jgi:toxin FitB
MSFLLDSNIIIYASKPNNEVLREFIKQNVPSVSFVSVIEVLGFNFTNKDERKYLEEFFNNSDVHLISKEIIKGATSLRQIRKISLADSIVAATALENNLTLVTHNIKDFDWIKGIKLLDPLHKH